jgi:hypothetical protein
VTNRSDSPGVDYSPCQHWLCACCAVSVLVFAQLDRVFALVVQAKFTKPVSIDEIDDDETVTASGYLIWCPCRIRMDTVCSFLC